MTRVQLTDDTPVIAVSAARAAKMIGVTASALAKWRKARKGPPWVPLSSRKTVYPVKDLEAFIRSRVFDPLEGK